MPVQLYTPPPITAPTINIQEILNNPSSSEEDKAEAYEALAIQQAQEAQAAAAMAQMQSLQVWVEMQRQALTQIQMQRQAQAQAQAEALLVYLQQNSQSIANGGTLNTNPIVTW
jgi:flagellar motor protein MotB